MASLSQVLARIEFGISAPSTIVIVKYVVSEMYSTTTGRNILELFYAANETLTVEDGVENRESTGDPYKIWYNGHQVDSTKFINKYGGVFDATDTRVVMHELIHTIKKIRDLDEGVFTTVNGVGYSDFSMYGINYTGPTVNFTNIIMGELGFGADQMRVSYTGNYPIENRQGGDNTPYFEQNWGIIDNFTFGETIDIAIRSVTANLAGNAIDTTGGGTRDLILGLELDERIETGDLNDFVYAGQGNDTVNAGQGQDYIDGGQGNDTLDGDSGHDIIIGGKNDDVILGHDGNDIIYGSRVDGEGEELEVDTLDYSQTDIPGPIEITPGDGCADGPEFLASRTIGGTSDSAQIYSIEKFILTDLDDRVEVPTLGKDVDFAMGLGNNSVFIGAAAEQADSASVIPPKNSGSQK